MVEAPEHGIQAEGVENTPEKFVPKAVDGCLFQEFRLLWIETGIPPIGSELFLDFRLGDQALFKFFHGILKKGEMLRKVSVEDRYGGGTANFFPGGGPSF